MGYAAYREHMGVPRTGSRTVFRVLDVTVACTDAAAVRHQLSGCEGVGVLRCEPLLHDASAETDALRVRLAVRLPATRYFEVLHAVLLCAPQGEIGRLLSWPEHLHRCGVRHE
ncbi:hypothetical protein PGB34_22995 [Xenophilus arseniciresistens]|uniref:Uncharacterized protein n=1 Tax=Xenophilus arseniciresistens TaxID=1283306 RepID=A0AAE3T1G5_9BURK|nr:hypothetical protein [Xenophilus arseniciresistens]MDA7419252.1 hypothetical protein [Xenophilus arseniciresistens]